MGPVEMAETETQPGPAQRRPAGAQARSDGIIADAKWLGGKMLSGAKAVGGAIDSAYDATREPSRVVPRPSTTPQATLSRPPRTGRSATTSPRAALSGCQSHEQVVSMRNKMRISQARGAPRWATPPVIYVLFCFSKL